LLDYLDQVKRTDVRGKERELRRGEKRGKGGKGRGNGSSKSVLRFRIENLL